MSTGAPLPSSITTEPQSKPTLEKKPTPPGGWLDEESSTAGPDMDFTAVKDTVVNGVSTAFNNAGAVAAKYLPTGVVDSISSYIREYLP